MPACQDNASFEQYDDWTTFLILGILPNYASKLAALRGQARVSVL